MTLVVWGGWVGGVAIFVFVKKVLIVAETQSKLQTNKTQHKQ